MDTQAYYSNTDALEKDYYYYKVDIECDIERLKKEYEDKLSQLEKRLERNKNQYEKCVNNLTNMKFQIGQKVKIKENYVKQHLGSHCCNELTSIPDDGGLYVAYAYTFKNLENIGVVAEFIVQGNGTKLYKITFNNFEYFDRGSHEMQAETYSVLIAEKFIEAV